MQTVSLYMPTAPLATPVCHSLRWTGVGWGMLAFVELGVLEVDATPSSSLDWGGVGLGMLAFVELGALEVDATPSSLLDRRICKQVLHHVKSFMWIYNNGVNLWTRLGAVAKKNFLKKTNRAWQNTINTIKKWIYVAPPCKYHGKKDCGLRPEAQIHGNSHECSRQL